MDFCVPLPAAAANQFAFAAIAVAIINGPRDRLPC
jgi:hypothetical protein